MQYIDIEAIDVQFIDTQSIDILCIDEQPADNYTHFSTQLKEGAEGKGGMQVWQFR